ncbi:MAG TPA: hypothetical protein VMS98_13955 [Thermoanaerobaculia bacterium]|nr:hypothetical protein [Thermoanaerobaculia bacterium]
MILASPFMGRGDYHALAAARSDWQAQTDFVAAVAWAPASIRRRKLWQEPQSVPMPQL